MKPANGKPRLGLVGYGYWGPNLLRNALEHGGFEVVGVADPAEEARERSLRLHLHVPVFADAADLIARRRPTAVLVASPPASHAAIAVQCLEAGADVLVEKPMALSVAECDRILDAARRTGRKVMVDHTFVYHPAVEYLAAETARGSFGELLYYDSVRVNLGGFQASANVLWDLAPHDLSILDRLGGGRLPLWVAAVGAHPIDQRNVSLCYCHLQYPGGLVAHLHLNWMAPIKVRTILLGGSKKMAVYDENLPAEKVKVYDKAVVVEDERVSFRAGDMVAPALSPREALAGTIAAFHRYVTGGPAPVSDGELGRRVIRILEAAGRSLELGGKRVEPAPAATPLRKAA